MARPLSPALQLSSTYAQDRHADLARAVAQGDDHVYTRWTNPTTDAVEAQLAELEGAAEALLVSSGVAAIHLALLAAVEGREGPLVVQEPVYGGTHELLAALRWELPVRRVHSRSWLHEDFGSGAVLFAEVPANPLVQLVDLPALRTRNPGARLIVDATFATPHLLRPLEHGADLVVHSATKYLGGHHDLVAGVIAGGELMGAVRRWRKILGPTLDPAAAWRLGRSLPTLGLRVERASASAAVLAERLQAHPAVGAVHHPSLTSHPDHALAQNLMGGHGGGVLAFELPGSDEAERCVDRLRLFATAASLGGTHSLAISPARVTHANVDDASLRAAGIAPGLVRLAVGLEDAESLWADLEQALG